MVERDLDDLGASAASYSSGGEAGGGGAFTISSTNAPPGVVRKLFAVFRHAPWALTLALLTVSLSWAAVHATFALHYAHDYYRGAKPGGLQFTAQLPNPCRIVVDGNDKAFTSEPSSKPRTSA